MDEQKPKQEDEEYKPPEKIRMGYITDNSFLRRADRDDVHATKLEFDLNEKLLEKKLGAERYKRLLAARSRNPATQKKRYVEPKGKFARIGDAFLMDAPRFDANTTPMPAESDVREHSESEQFPRTYFPTATVAVPSRKVEESYGANNVFHSPSLDVPLFEDRGADDDRGMAAKALSWRWWLSREGVADIRLKLYWAYLRVVIRYNLFKLQLSLVKHGTAFTNPHLAALSGFAYSCVRHYGLFKRYGLKIYLRWRKYRKTGGAPLREVAWTGQRASFQFPNMAQPQEHAAYLAAPMEETEFGRRLEAALVEAERNGSDTTQVVRLFYALWTLEDQYRRIGLKFESKNTPIVAHATKLLSDDVKHRLAVIEAKVAGAITSKLPAGEIEKALLELKEVLTNNFADMPEGTVGRSVVEATQRVDMVDVGFAPQPSPSSLAKYRCPHCNALEAALIASKAGDHQCTECGKLFHFSGDFE